MQTINNIFCPFYAQKKNSLVCTMNENIFDTRTDNTPANDICMKTILFFVIVTLQKACFGRDTQIDIKAK